MAAFLKEKSIKGNPCLVTLFSITQKVETRNWYCTLWCDIVLLHQKSWVSHPFHIGFCMGLLCCMITVVKNVGWFESKRLFRKPPEPFYKSENAVSFGCWSLLKI